MPPEDIAAGEDSAAVIFDSQTALARISAAWTMSRFVEIYNGIDNGTIKKFANRQKAVERIWRAIQPQSGLTSSNRVPHRTQLRSSHRQRATPRSASLANRAKRRRVAPRIVKQAAKGPRWLR